MKMGLSNPFLVALLAGTGSLGSCQAQALTTLHSFSPNGQYFGILTNKDGAIPRADLVLAGNALYGATTWASPYGAGTVFKVNVDGTSFTTLHIFGPWDGASCYGIIESSNVLYGTTLNGGTQGNELYWPYAGGGIVFKLNTDGTEYTKLADFDPPTLNFGNSGCLGPVLLSGDRLYGTRSHGGSYPSNGAVFAIDTDGTSVNTLYGFSAPSSGSPQVNDDGAWPDGALVLSGSTLYGVTDGGGSSGYGTAFALNTNGTGFTNLHNFADGATPVRGLILVSNSLYGVTFRGGLGGNGTVFRINTDGTGFATLHYFSGSDGSHPHGRLVSYGSTLYGTTEYGGGWGNGLVFALNLEGTQFTILHSFSELRTNVSGIYTNSDGATPGAGLTLASAALYGTTTIGGLGGSGTVFSISLLPQLTITPAGENLVLSWPTNYAGFDFSSFIIESTTSLVSPIWTTNLPVPVVVKGQFEVTTSIPGTQQFFRLMSR